MIPALRPEEPFVLAQNQLSQLNEVDGQTQQLVINSLKRLTATPETIRSLLAFVHQIENNIHLRNLANEVKQAIKPLSLYSPAEAPSLYEKLTSVTFSDLFIDGGAPWQKIYDYVFSSLTHISANHLELAESNEDTAELQTKTLELIRLIRSSDKSSVKYPLFIDKLREIYNLAATHALPDHPFVRYVRRVCFSHYNDLFIYPFCETLISSMLDEGRKQLNKYDPGICPFTLPLEEQIRLIHAAPQKLKAPLAYLLLNRFCGAVSVFYDPHRQNNIPWALFDFEIRQADRTEKKVRVLRMGTPTYQRTSLADMTWEGKATIDPGFILFIQQLVDLNQKILFISLQNDLTLFIGTENTRNDAQKQLAIQFPKNFFYSIFSHDNLFYHQTGEYEKISDARKFKDIFFDKLLGRYGYKNGFHFPESWVNDQSFRDILTALLGEMHFVLFEDKETLTQKERCQFIQIFYIFLALRLLVKTGADKLVFCCKDSIDRAGIENALLHYILLIFYDLEMSEEHLRNMMVFIHAATVIVKQQEMNQRHERLLWALEILQDPQVRLRIKARKDRIYGIVGRLQIAKRSD